MESVVLSIVAIFDTKVKNICARGVTNFNSPFLTEFFISFERYCCPELKFEKIFHL